MNENVVLQLSYAGETHEMTISLRSSSPKDDLSYELVLAKVQETFPQLAHKCWTLVYRDDEGDVVTLSHTLEFDEACRVFLAMSPKDKDTPRTLHFCVLQRISLREKVVAPVLQKIMELARDAATYMRNSDRTSTGRCPLVRLANVAILQAGVTINNIRNSDVLGRGRASLGISAAHTRTLLLSARSGMSSQFRRASSVVSAGIERRRSSSGVRSAFDSTPFSKPHSVHQQTSMPSAEVAETVDLRQTELPVLVAEMTVNNSDEEPPALILAADVEELQEPAAVYESDTDTLCDDDDREWDVVNTTGHSENIIAETDEEWSRELQVIREVLTHVDEERCCELLCQYDGDVQTVLMELTDL
ncbi:hypothetical protein CCR75_006425 [Bremia lactucae]|uniref:PB1 domain-containing protein n=1 Tax=Bremia lactucae TaxID=4779 RepID=A0A976FJJ9_BRELC|nr:hypothetical protein CCR75_006425 [Bremia lactucae]